MRFCCRPDNCFAVAIVEQVNLAFHVQLAFAFLALGILQNVEVNRREERIVSFNL